MTFEANPVDELQLQNQLNAIVSYVNGENSPAPTYDQTALHQALGLLKSKAYPQAAKWMRLAAMQANPKAQFYLGLMFAKGQGLPKSVFHAAAWLSLAASQDYPQASEALSRLRKYLSTKRMCDAQTYAATLYEQIHDLTSRR